MIGGQIRRETAVYLAGFVFAGSIQFLALPVYARGLGPEEYGLLAVALAVATGLAGLMALGGDVALTRYWPEVGDAQAQKALASTWITFLFLWSLLVASVGCVVLLVAPLEEVTSAALPPILMLATVGVVPTLLSTMLAQVLRNTFRIVPFAVTTGLLPLLTVPLGAILGLSANLGAAGVVLGTMIGQAVGAGIRVVLVRRYLGGTLAWHLVPGLLRLGVPLVPVSLGNWVFVGADRLAVARYLPGATVGAYGFAAALVGAFTVLTLAMGQAWLPRLSHLYVVDPQRARTTASRALLRALWGLGAAACLTGVVARPLIRTVAGANYEAGSYALPLLALGAAFAGASVFASSGLIMAKRTTRVLGVTLLAAAVDVLLLVLLVPRFGVVGAGTSVAAAYFVLLHGLVLASRRDFPLDISLGSVLFVTVPLLALSALAAWLPSPASALLSLLTVCGLLLALYLDVRRGSASRN
jgi:O-antigen/teichoic acid export membrane protein